MVDLDKVKIIKKLEQLTNLLQAKSFLCHIGYYMKFLKGYVNMAHPKEQLLKKETTFEWTSKCHYNFKELKIRIINALILRFRLQ